LFKTVKNQKNLIKIIRTNELPETPFRKMVKAWMIEDETISVSESQLADLGVESFLIDADNYETEGKLDKICKEKQYAHRSIVNIHPDTLPNYDTMVKKFYEEHLHEFDEIRFILDGEGWFDVRDKQDQWIRILCSKGDLIVLPAGIYHRFTTTETNYVKAMRFENLIF
jgi:1,2-dihydroxy-3-keto-5-methylthiopentene dioxygenase